MNRPFNPPAASKSPCAAIPVPGEARAPVTPIGAAALSGDFAPFDCPTGEAGAPNLSTYSDPPNFIELGYGTGPRCIQCHRNVSVCHCDDADIDVPSVEDMARIWDKHNFLAGIVTVDSNGVARVAY